MGVLKRIGLAHYKLGAFDEARSIFLRVLRSRPEDGYARKALRRIARLQGKAIPPFQATVASKAKATLLSVTVEAKNAETPEEAYNEGRRLYLEGKFDEAAPCFSRALAGEHEVYASRFHLADCQLKSVRNLEEVCALFEACIAMKPDLVPPYIRLALALGARGDQDGQIEALERCLVVDPDSSEAHFHLALAYDRKDDAQTSFRHAKEAIRLDPSYRDRFPGLLRNTKVAGRISSILDGALDKVHLSDDEIESYAKKITDLLGAENLRADLESDEGRQKVRNLIADESRLERLRNAFRAKDPEGLKNVLTDSEIDVDVDGALQRFRALGKSTF